MTDETSAATGAGEIEKRLRQLGENMKAAFDNPDFHEPLLSAADALAALREENERVRLANLDCVDHFNQMKADLAASRQREEELIAQVIEAEKYNGWHQLACIENEKLRLKLWRYSQDVTNAELKLAERHCDWAAFKHAFNAVMASRRAALSEKPAAEKEVGS